MKPRQERIEYFKRLEKVANEDELNKDYYTIKNWRGKPLALKKIQVDAEYLMFRIENSRTEIQQLSYLRKRSLPDDHFDDPESKKAQEAQEDILIEMVKQKGKDILEDLRLRGQEDPCIITYDGYIVNGNRRTSALKYLGERYIQCVVLKEDASPKDIYTLEQQLQIAQDFREDYHWINELRNINRGIQDDRYEFSEADLAANLRLDVKDLKVKLRTFELVDAFLLWKEIPKQYDYTKLDDAEEIFRQLEKAIKKYSKDFQKMEALKNAVFMLIEERPAKGRLYGYVMDLIKNFDKVYERMQDEGLEEDVNDGNEIEDIEDILSDDESTSNDAFSDHKDASSVSSELVETIQDIKAENKERKNAEAVYESVSIALRELQGLTIDDETAKIESIKNKLDQIIDASKRLLNEIENN